MSSLNDVLGNEAKKPQIIDDCMSLIDAEVAEKGGISGLALKAGYAAVKGVKPGFVRQVITDLLPEFSTALDPIYQEAKGSGKAIGDHIGNERSRVADALLSITDGKAKNSKSGVVKGTYDKLRGTAKKHVEAATPRLGKLIEKYSA